MIQISMIDLLLPAANTAEAATDGGHAAPAATPFTALMASLDAALSCETSDGNPEEPNIASGSGELPAHAEAAFWLPAALGLLLARAGPETMQVEPSKEIQSTGMDGVECANAADTSVRATGLSAEVVGEPAQQGTLTRAAPEDANGAARTDEPNPAPGAAEPSRQGEGTATPVEPSATVQAGSAKHTEAVGKPVEQGATVWANPVVDSELKNLSDLWDLRPVRVQPGSTARAAPESATSRTKPAEAGTTVKQAAESANGAAKPAETGPTVQTAVEAARDEASPADPGPRVRGAVARQPQGPGKPVEPPAAALEGENAEVVKASEPNTTVRSNPALPKDLLDQRGLWDSQRVRVQPSNAGRADPESATGGLETGSAGGTVRTAAKGAHGAARLVEAAATIRAAAAKQPEGAGKPIEPGAAVQAGTVKQTEGVGKPAGQGVTVEPAAAEHAQATSKAVEPGTVVRAEAMEHGRTSPKHAGAGTPAETSAPEQAEGAAKPSEAAAAPRNAPATRDLRNPTDLRNLTQARIRPTKAAGAAENANGAAKPGEASPTVLERAPDPPQPVPKRSEPSSLVRAPKPNGADGTEKPRPGIEPRETIRATLAQRVKGEGKAVEPSAKAQPETANQRNPWNGQGQRVQPSTTVRPAVPAEAVKPADKPAVRHEPGATSAARPAPAAASARVEAVQAVTDGRPAAPEELGAVVLKSVRYMLGRNEHVVKVRLVPESLGELHVEVSSSDHTVTVRLAAATASARQLIEEQLPGLREVLARDGIQVTSLTVSSDGVSGQGPASHEYGGLPHSGLARTQQTYTQTYASPGKESGEMRRFGASHDGSLDVFA